MALSIGVKLGRDTSYFCKIKHKPYFGNAKEEIEKEDVQKALSLI
jgi:adenosylcobinamide-phosphate synthase